MTCRLVGRAEDQIDALLLESARKWGIAAAGNYHRLMLTAFTALAASPMLLGSRRIDRIVGVRAYPLRLGRSLVEPDQRAGQPRHIVVYRLGPDGIVEILGLAHDRMLLGRAARRMQRGSPR
jgi:toxin ParE1/3/4